MTRHTTTQNHGNKAVVKWPNKVRSTPIGQFLTTNRNEFYYLFMRFLKPPTASFRAPLWTLPTSLSFLLAGGSIPILSTTSLVAAAAGTLAALSHESEDSQMSNHIGRQKGIL